MDTDPLRAAKIADTTAQVFKDQVPAIVGQDYVRLLSNAKVDPLPINQKNYNKIIYSVIFGLVVGVGLAFLIESLDDTIRSDREIEAILGVPVLGRISKMNKKNIKKKNNKQPDLELRGETIGYK
jgi:capsular polysaccharide biosynthesis protein